MSAAGTSHGGLIGGARGRQARVLRARRAAIKSQHECGGEGGFFANSARNLSRHSAAHAMKPIRRIPKITIDCIECNISAENKAEYLPGQAEKRQGAEDDQRIAAEKTQKSRRPANPCADHFESPGENRRQGETMDEPRRRQKRLVEGKQKLRLWDDRPDRERNR